MEFTEEQIARYGRHILLPEVGGKGRKKIARSRVLIGTIQATEALKLILGIGRPLTDRLLDFDARHATFRQIHVKRNARCSLCGDSPTITELTDHQQEVCQVRAVPAADSG